MNIRVGLNRTSVGLKLDRDNYYVRLYLEPQSNQRGIETTRFCLF